MPVDPGEEADIYFYAMEFANNSGGVSTGVDHDHGSRIALNTFLGAVPDLQPGSGGFETLVHEIGHSLGLTHPGDYNADDDEFPTYYDDAEYIQDTRMYSVMSYFDGAETGYSDDGDGLVSLIATPRTHDMFVVQSLYSANFDARDTNSTYGYNAEDVGALYDFTNFGGADQWDTSAAHNLGRRRRRHARSVRRRLRRHARSAARRVLQHARHDQQHLARLRARLDAE